MFSDAAVIAAVNAVTGLLNTGHLKIYTGAQPTDANSAITGTLLADLVLNATAFITPAVASGTAGSRLVTATANAITNATAAASGTAGYFTLEASNGTTVHAYGSVGTSGADLNLNSLAISLGATVSCSAFTIVMPEQ
jgi:hypothetical protein